MINEEQKEKEIKSYYHIPFGRLSPMRRASEQPTVFIIYWDITYRENRFRGAPPAKYWKYVTYPIPFDEKELLALDPLALKEIVEKRFNQARIDLLECILDENFDLLAGEGPALDRANNKANHQGLYDSDRPLPERSKGG